MKKVNFSKIEAGKTEIKSERTQSDVEEVKTERTQSDEYDDDEFYDDFTPSSEDFTPPSTETARPSEQTETQTNQTLKPGLKGVFTMPLVVAVLSASFGSSFQFGFHLACLNTPGEIIVLWQNTSFQAMHPGIEYKKEIIWSITIGIHSLGAICSSIFVGYFANKFGRKKVLLVNNAFVVLNTVLMCVAFLNNNYMFMIAGRFVIGMNGGINMGICPMYLSEIAPINLRGAIACIAQVFTSFGILVAQIIGLPYFLGDNDFWIWIFIFPLVPVCVQLLNLGFFAPESPKYLYILEERVLEAQATLKMLKGVDDVDDELDLLDFEARIANTHKHLGFFAMLKDGEMRWALILALFIAFSIQFSGVIAVTVYSTQIFRNAKLDPHTAQLATCGMGALGMFMIFVSLFLVQMPLFGRRILYLTSCIGCCAMTALFAIVTSLEWGGVFSLVCIVSYMILYSLGMGSIGGLYVNEIFSSETRAIGSGFGMMLIQIFRMIIQSGFPKLEQLLGPMSFCVFSGCLLFSSVLGFIILPETKNKVYERVRRDIKRRRKLLTRCCPCC